MSQNKHEADPAPGRRRRSPAPRVWTNRLRDGRLRVQCQTCYDSELDANVTYRVCLDCRARLVLKKSEMDRFRDLMESEEGAGVGAPAPPATVRSFPTFDSPFPSPFGFQPIF